MKNQIYNSVKYKLQFLCRNSVSLSCSHKNVQIQIVPRANIFGAAIIIRARAMNKLKILLIKRIGRPKN